MTSEDVRTLNDLADKTDWPVVEVRLYLPDRTGHHSYVRIIAHDALESIAMEAFYKDDAWHEGVMAPYARYRNDRREKARTAAGFIKRIVSRLLG